MFTISNTRKIGDLNFATAKGKPVRLRPGVTLSFEDTDMNDGILRTMIGKGSFYKLLADTADAQEMIDKASQRKPKKNGSPIVHGSTDPVDFQRGRDHPIEIRDQKGPNDDISAAQKKREGEGGEKGEQAPAPEITKKVFIQEEVKEKTPLQKLIEVATDKPYTELVTEAKELLGEAFPEGRPGRKPIIEALKAADTPQPPQE